MTDLSTLIDATQVNTPADRVNSAISTLLATSHDGTNEEGDDGGSEQEPIRMCLQEPSNEQDDDSAVQTILQPPEENSRTETGRTETTPDHHEIGYKREHSHSPVRQCSHTPPPAKVVITCTCTCGDASAGCLESELVIDGRALSSHHQREERLPRKRVRHSTMEGEGKGGGNGHTSPGVPEAPGVQPDAALPPPQLVVMEQDHHSRSSPEPRTSSEEATALCMFQQPPPSPPPATTRGAMNTPTRPTSLLVSLPLPNVSPSAVAVTHAGEGDDRFPSSEEEQTPDGGKREFVGHPYRYTPINNGETVVTPERQTIPPNIVLGHKFPLNAYRRQVSDNNASYHSLSRRELLQTSSALRRQNSAPPYHHGTAETGRDNNGQIIGDGHCLHFRCTPTP